MLPSAASLRQTGGRELERIVFDDATSARRVRGLGEEITAVYPSGEPLEICALLHKHVAEHLVLEPVYVGFDAPRVFLVGYGLDHAENFRHLPYIASLT